MQRSFIHIRDDELEIGLAYAKDKYGVTLSEETLRILFNKTGELALTLEERGAHIQARRQILDEELEQKTPEQRRRFKAYNSAIGKIASRRALYSRRQRKHPQKLTETQRIKEQLFLRDNQYAFV